MNEEANSQSPAVEAASSPVEETPPVETLRNTMVAAPLGSIMLAYNHLSYAIKAGSFNNLRVEELNAVVTNTVALKQIIPEKLRKQLE